MNSQTNEPHLDWKNKDLDSLPRDAAQQILVTAWNKELKSFEYNIVAYHAPMELWYGGPGVLVKEAEVQYWAEIPAPEPPVGADN